MLTNTDGLCNKMSKLKVKVETENPDVIGICETWFQNDPLNKYFYPNECTDLKGYNAYRYDNTGAVRGGLLLYVKPNIDGGVCKEMLKYTGNFEESAWHWLRLPNTKSTERLLIGCIYRKGASSVDNNTEMFKAMEKSCQVSDLVTLCGDFNFPGISWKLNQGSSDKERQFLDVIDDNNLNQHVHEFTRKRGTDNPSTIDLVLTDDQQIIDKPNVTEPLGNSDHSVILWNSTFKCTEEEQTEFVPTPNFFKGNYNKMRTEFEQIDWDERFLPCKDVNEMVKKFETIINEKVEQCIPMKKKNPGSKQAPWITHKLLRTIKRKYHAWKRFQETKGHEGYMQYVKERRKAAKKVKSAKKAFEEKLAKLCKINPKAFYSYANTKKKSATNFIRLKKTVGSTDKTMSDSYTISDQETAEELNNYFSSVFTKDVDEGILSFNYFAQHFMREEDIEPISLPYYGENKIGSVSITIDQVKDLLSSIDSTKAGGDDNVHPKVLKECCEQLAIPLQRIFHCSVETGVFPNSWKTATITPLHKSEERDLAENYRPISITSQVGKILEKIVRQQMFEFIIENDLLSPHQHGFCQGRSCMTNLLEALEDITRLVDEGIPVDELFLDFRKAFDKVSHSKLLYKLHHMGVDGNLLNWIESFLSGRTQRVKVNAGLSSWAKVTSGVPQGSVLGPLLFLVFINDLPALLKTNCKLFADDSKLYSAVSSFEEHNILQEDLNRCQEWAEQWGMEFHPKKCKVLHYGKKNPRYNYQLGGQPISHYEEEKDLGIIITEDLHWDAHIAMCIKKANTMIGMVKRTFTYMDKDMFNSLYKTLIRPMLEYCPQVWNPHLARNIVALEKVQRRATKIVPELKNLPYEQRLLALKLYPLEDRRLRGDMIATFKMMKGLLTIDTNNLIPLNNMTNSITRSHSYQLMGMRCNTVWRKNFFTQRIVLPWNALNRGTVESDSIDTFKSRYDREMLGRFK